MTTLETRRLDWNACQNARDSHGLPAGDGAVIRKSALIRSDNHHRLTAHGQAALRALGISLILDLRFPAETQKFPSPFASDPSYRNVPLFDLDDHEGRALVRAAREPLANYTIMIDRYAHLVGRAISIMADAPPGGIVVHCHAGKDRTGVIVALALRVAGVPADEVAADYALTDECLREHYAEELARQHDETERQRTLAWQRSSPDTMLAVLRHIDEQDGGVWPYLIRAGVTPQQLEHLRARLRA